MPNDVKRSITKTKLSVLVDVRLDRGVSQIKYLFRECLRKADEIIYQIFTSTNAIERIIYYVGPHFALKTEFLPEK